MLDLNVPNRTIYCLDNLDVLQGINSECIDLIYLDPPFNTKKKFVAPIGSTADGASFKDIFRKEDVKDEWLQTIKEDHENAHKFLNGIKSIEGRTSYNFCYLVYMSIRLIECHRILKDTGSLYLHCDPTMSHYLKILLDCIFGEKNFRNEIVWCYTGPGSPKMRQFNRKHDVLFWFNKGTKWVFNSDEIRLPYKDPNQRPRRAFDTGLAFQEESIKAMRERGKVPETWWRDISVVVRSKKENIGYPTQKPLKLLERIIKASCPEHGTVLDPFCGCATSCVAAEILERNWIGIDVSVKAKELIELRLNRAFESNLLKKKPTFNFRVNPPQRTETSAASKSGKYVYIVSNEAYPEYYKVGIALDWKKRLNSYQTGDPDRGYSMNFNLLTEHYRDIEKHIHQHFGAKGEWVRASLEDIKAEIVRYNKELS